MKIKQALYVEVGVIICNFQENNYQLRYQKFQKFCKPEL